MARLHLDPPLAPRKGEALEAISIDRISTKNQDPKSNDDQRALLRNWVADHYDGSVNWTEITGQGSGERTDRSQVREVEELVESGRFDLVIMEDLARHMRRSRATDLCELCEDNDTRLIAINDGIDTAKDWRLHAFFAAFKHEQSNKDTSSRIKRTLGNRFINGGVLQTFVYGIIKPPGAKSDSELTKDPTAEAIYDEWFDRLEKGASYSEIADWLNANKVPVGPWSRRKKWDCAMVGRVTHNPILKGLRIRNRRKSKRVNKSGKYISVKAAPEEMLKRECPHLAFIEPERYDRVIRLLAERNKKFSRNKNGHDPLTNRPRKRTRWPGQHLHCAICGRKFVYGGHGQTHHLQCDGTREYRCWQSFTVDGPLAAQKMSAAIFDAISALPEFDEVLLQQVHEELMQQQAGRAGRLHDIDNECAKLDRQIHNIALAIAQFSGSTALLDQLRALESAKAGLEDERSILIQLPDSVAQVPTIAVVKAMALQEFQGIAVDTPEFGRLIRHIVPKIVVFPVRCIDGGEIVMRARFVINLVSLVAGGHLLPAMSQHLQRELVVDLFDPPQRVEYREQVMSLRASGLTEKQAAEQLGLTITAAQKAAALARKLRSLDVTDPYVPVLEPPADFGQLKMHRHPRYRFEPLGLDDVA